MIYYKKRLLLYIYWTSIAGLIRKTLNKAKIMNNTNKAINDLRAVLNSGYAAVVNLGAIYGMEYALYEIKTGGLIHQIVSSDGLIFEHVTMQKARRGYDVIASDSYTLTSTQAAEVVAMLNKY